MKSKNTTDENNLNSSSKQTKKDNLEKYKKLREIFDQKDKTGFNSINEFGIDYGLTQAGLFLPSGTSFLDKLFKDLISEGYIDRKKVFLDAGSGDGRVNHVAAINGVESSVGIEYSVDILEKSKIQTRKFEDENIFNKNVVKLIAGDFTKLNTYTRNGVEVESIGAFFNYLNGWRDLINFVDKNSASGTKLILIDQQFKVAERVIQEISKFESINLLKIVKYVYQKNTDTVDILTPEKLKDIKKDDLSIEDQHTFLDISGSDKISVLDSSNYCVTTVYLCEKN